MTSSLPDPAGFLHCPVCATPSSAPRACAPTAPAAPLSPSPTATARSAPRPPCPASRAPTGCARCRCTSRAGRALRSPARQDPQAEVRRDVRLGDDLRPAPRRLDGEPPRADAWHRPRPRQPDPHRPPAPPAHRSDHGRRLHRGRHRAFPLSPPSAHRLVAGSQTPRSANRNLDDERAAAAAHAAALTWTGDTGDIKGAAVLLVDDVSTSGSQLQQVALRLRTSGAADVRGLVLARVPWSG